MHERWQEDSQITFDAEEKKLGKAFSKRKRQVTVAPWKYSTGSYAAKKGRIASKATTKLLLPTKRAFTGILTREQDPCSAILGWIYRRIPEASYPIKNLRERQQFLRDFSFHVSTLVNQSKLAGALMMSTFRDAEKSRSSTTKKFGHVCTLQGLRDCRVEMYKWCFFHSVVKQSSCFFSIRVFNFFIFDFISFESASPF